MNYKEIKDAIDAITLIARSPEPSLFDTLYGMPKTLMGMKIIERPSPPPRIQLRNITLSDGTPLFSDEFRSETNRWLLDRFGLAPDPFADKLFLIGGWGISVSPAHAVMIKNIV
jgi:hypothetical protein